MLATAPSHASRSSERGARRRFTWSAAAALVFVALAAPVTTRGYEKTFSAGALIIPAQQEYQTDSGMVSAYGLVYTLLYKNAALIAQGKKPITIYWTVEPRKQSHHRCWTGDNTLPDFSGFNDNDGCDFAVQNAAGSPVSRIAPNGSVVSPFWACGLDATVSSTITRNASSCDPQTVSAVEGSTGTKRFRAFEVGPSKTVMKYSGGQWVIEAVDRDTVLSLLATDTELAQYHKDGTCGNTNLGAGCHYVNIHSANASFTAPVARMINVKPPLIALLGAGAVNILRTYLDNAGLTNITNYEGPLAREPSTNNITEHGVIYDVLDPVGDFVSKASSGPLANGILNYPADLTDPFSLPFYQVLWAPHWVAASQSTLPRDGDPGDETSNDGVWIHNGDDAITNALKNIAAFADQGNGIFAECASIESFEGSYKESTAACNSTYACQLTSDPTQTTPYECPAGSTAACNACYSCPTGMNLNAASCQELMCVGTCAVGTTPACDACYECPAGYTVNADNCNDVVCVPSPLTCDAPYQAACSGCYSCDSGWTMVSGSCTSAPTCHRCKESGFTYSPGLGQCLKCKSGGTWNEAQLKCYNGTTDVGYDKGEERSPRAARTPSYSSATSVGTSAQPPTQQAATCQAGYTLFCPGATLPIDVPGHEATHFQVSNRLIKNGLGSSFSGPDCTDRTASVVGFHDGGTGDCFDFHPEVGGPGNIFSQKGNFSYTGTSGHIHQYKPPVEVGSVYWPNVFRMVTSRNAGTSSRDGWDFASTRHKDGDPAKGMVVYLAGHTYNNNPAGTRVVLNTLLNLGFSSAGVELARSEPVGYHDAGLDKNRVYQGTYVQLPPPGPFQDWAEYTVGSPHSWRFPYTTGHLYEYELGQISSTPQAFKDHKNWDAADKMPSPGNRTIFTTLGGSGNLAWTRINFSHEQTGSTCTDADGDNKCDLSEQLAACATAGVTTATLKAKDDATGQSQRDTLGMFVQQVRGFCSAHNPKITGSPIFTPAEAECDDLKQQKNKARLGGVDHGSPAVVGPSRYVTDAPWATRPVVAYVGARDGMLHAIYVSGGTGWKDPAGDGLPAGVVSGQELWAFLPPGQICGLATNNAMVDASVNVIDVFGSFPTDANGDGVIGSGEGPTGTRRWRTVLLAAAGQGGSELFAMDVTNPIKPVLLWHVSGVSEKDGRWDTDEDGTFEAGESFDATDAGTYAFRWLDTSVANGVTKEKTGRYDWSNLGLTYGTAVGRVWEGNANRYIGYVATSSADFTDASAPLGYKGVEVFAFDLITGQKLWQWQRRYARTNTSGTVIADNTIPGRLALADVDADGSVDRLYVGDMEGHLWELDARRGGNLNYLASQADSTKRYSFPLFGTKDMVGTGADASTTSLFKVSAAALAQQPLTSPIGMGRFTQVPTTPVDLTPYLLGRLAIVQGTMGVDWAIAPFEKGNVYVLPAHWESPSRIAYFSSSDTVDLSVTPNPLVYGLLKPEAVWDIELLTGERVFGMPRIVNNHVIFNTAFGSFTGDITSSLEEAGNLYDVSASSTQVTANDSKSFGGVLLFQDKVVVTTAKSIKASNAPASLKGGTQAQKPFNRSTPATFKTFEPPSSTDVKR